MQLVGQGGGVAEPLLQSLKEATKTLEESIHNPELKKLVTITREYVEKRIKGQDVDDVAAIKEIVKTLISVVDKIVLDFNVPKELPFTDSVSF